MKIQLHRVKTIKSEGRAEIYQSATQWRDPARREWRTAREF